MQALGKIDIFLMHMLVAMNCLAENFGKVGETFIVNHKRLVVIYFLRLVHANIARNYILGSLPMN